MANQETPIHVAISELLIDAANAYIFDEVILPGYMSSKDYFRCASLGLAIPVRMFRNLHDPALPALLHDPLPPASYIITHHGEQWTNDEKTRFSEFWNKYRLIQVQAINTGWYESTAAVSDSVNLRHCTSCL